MNKKQQSSNKRRKRASIGLAVCFAAAIVLTGAYTWRNYRANVKDEQAKIEEEQQAKEEEIKSVEGFYCENLNNFGKTSSTGR